ncbi:MAG TPA: hypothetical protein H9778_07830, partial [Candidatus Parabacteroides intestinavium]|nr:hypothetical protein [Candidatus Parabacteroides intestinavium]
PGLEQAREMLRITQMSPDERSAYYRHLDNIVILKDNIITEREEGRMEGRAEGKAEGRAEGLKEGRKEGQREALLQTARNLQALGLSVEQIVQATGLPVQEVENILKKE